MAPETAGVPEQLPSAAISRRPLLLEQTSILLMVVLTVMTLGLYHPIWFLRRRAGLNQLDAPRKLQRWPFILVLVFIVVQVCVSLVFGPRAGAEPTSGQRAVELTFRFLQLPLALLIVVQYFFVKDIIEDHLAGTPDDAMMARMTYDAVKLPWALTLFLNIYYLQHIINRKVVGVEERSSDVAAGTPTLAAPRYAGFWLRCAAAMIDGLILVASSIGAGIVIGGIATLGRGRFETGFVDGYYLVAIGLAWLYYALAESSARQATIGKRAVGIVVSDAAGHRITFAHATGRAFAKLLNALTFGIGWLLAAFTARKQGLHDHLAGTVVTLRQDTPPLGRTVIALICVGTLVPIVGIIAAAAIPGLLRAQMSGNEASAIGTLRALRDAQQTYRQTCDGFAPNVRELIRLSGGEFGTVAGQTISRRGYTFMIRPSGLAVRNQPPSCEGPVTDYLAQASPLEPGATGSRYFITDGRGIIFESPDQGYSSVTPVK